MKKLFIPVLFVCFSLAMASAQEYEDYTKHPGYVDFGNLDGFKDSEETVEVFIKGPLLKFVSRAIANEDPSLSRLLDDLLLIKVDVFSINRNKEEAVKSTINKVAQKLQSQKWERAVRAKERNEQVEIFTQFNDKNELSGLVIMAMEKGDEAVFVNIVGKIDPDQLGKLSGKFHIPKLDSVEIKKK